MKFQLTARSTARKPLASLSHSLVDAKMGVVQRKCGRGQIFSRALCALFSFGPSNLMYVPTPMLIATPDHGYFWIGVGKGGGGQPLAPGKRTCERLREIAYQR